MASCADLEVRETERERSPVCWFTPQVPVKARAKPTPKLGSRSSMCFFHVGTGTQLLELSPAAASKGEY